MTAAVSGGVFGLVAQRPGGDSGDDVGRDLVADIGDGGYVVRAVRVVRENDAIPTCEGRPRGRLHTHLRHQPADRHRPHARADEYLAERRAVEAVVPGLADHVLTRPGLDRQIQLPPRRARLVVRARRPVVLQVYDDRPRLPSAVQEVVHAVEQTGRVGYGASTRDEGGLDIDDDERLDGRCGCGHAAILPARAPSSNAFAAVPSHLRSRRFPESNCHPATLFFRKARGRRVRAEPAGIAGDRGLVGGRRWVVVWVGGCRWGVGGWRGGCS